MHEGFDSFGRVRADDQAGVMVAVEALDDLRSVVAAGVGLLLARETDDASGVALLWFRQGVLHVEEGGDFDSGPLDPGVEAGGEFDDFGDVGAADAGGGFEEVEAAVGVRLDELGVGDAGDEAERFDDVGVDCR